MSIVPQHRPRRAQNVKTPLLTGRTVPSLVPWVTSLPHGDAEITLRYHKGRLIPGNTYKAPREDGRAPQWVATTPDGGAFAIRRASRLRYVAIELRSVSGRSAIYAGKPPKHSQKGNGMRGIQWT